MRRARRQHAELTSRSSGRGRAADRDRLSASGHARLRRRRRVDSATGTLAGARHLRRIRDRVLLPGYFVRVRVPRRTSRTRCWCRMSRSAAIRAGATCWSSTRTTWSSSARSRSARMVGELRVIESGLEAGRSRRRRRHPARDPGPEGRSADADHRSAAAPAAGAASSGRRHDLEILHRAAGSRQRARHPDGGDRRRRAVRAAGRAISRRRAADRAGHHALSRRQRPHRHRHRRAADRAAGQRRRGHDLHAVLQRRRRHLHADRDVQDRHRSQLRAGAGAEPGLERAVARCRRRCRRRASSCRRSRPRSCRS